MPQNPDNKPIDQWLGIKQVKNAGESVFQMSPADKHLGNPAIKAIHGGVVTIFLERIAEIELAAETNSPKDVTLINTNIDFLRSAKLNPLFGSAKIVKLGRRLAVIDVRAWQKEIGAPVAKATVSLTV
jgi:uncharacterized protein (TIGR00369 family)